jgi:hypothetical protein
VLKSAQEVGFRWRHTIPPDRQSVIDPVLTYSTYLAGSSFDKGQGIAVDFSGNAYVTGFTQSTDFPGASSSPIQSSRKAVRAPSWPRSTVLAARSTIIPASAATARFRLEDGIAWPGLRIRKVLHLQRLPEFCDYCSPHCFSPMARASTSMCAPRIVVEAAITHPRGFDAYFPSQTAMIADFAVRT